MQGKKQGGDDKVCKVKEQSEINDYGTEKKEGRTG